MKATVVRMASSSPSTGPCRVVVRSKTKVELFTCPERETDDPQHVVTAADSKQTLVNGATSLQVVSPDGSIAYFLLVGHGVIACPLNPPPSSPLSSSKETKPFLEDSKNVQMMELSPSGTFLITWERWYQDKCPYNLKVWNTEKKNPSSGGATLVAAFAQKGLKRESWPYVHFSYDEKVAFLLATNEVRIYPKEAFLATTAQQQQQPPPHEIRYSDALRLKGATAISVPKTAVEEKLLPSNYFFTSFCPCSKDKPAKASMHQYSLLKKTTEVPKGTEYYPAVVSKAIFRAEEMKTHWNPVGDAALITLATSVDATGESYYGSSQLFLLAPSMLSSSSSKTDNSLISVPLPQEGVIHSVQWMPNPNKPPCFVVVAGKMPAMASLHHGITAQPEFLFGNAHRNTVCWSPHGRFLLLAGFGNLAGGMGLWDRNKCKLIPSVRDGGRNATGNLRVEAVVGYDWSPDSRLLVTSTTSPRMNVDNGLRLFRYNGEEISSNVLPWNNKDYQPDQLLQVTFVPALLKTYPDRPQSPLPTGVAAAAAVPSTSNTAAAASALPAAAKPPGRYVPPSARNRAAGGASGTSLADRMRKEKEGSMQGATKVQPATANKFMAAAGAPKSALTGRAIPGMAPPEQKSKTAVKREKAKLKKEQEEARQKEIELQQQQQQQESQQKPPQEEEQQQQDPEKRARKLKKVLKQIDEYKQRDPSTLDDAQKAKMDTEANVREELAQLGL